MVNTYYRRKGIVMPHVTGLVENIVYVVYVKGPYLLDAANLVLDKIGATNRSLWAVVPSFDNEYVRGAYPNADDIRWIDLPEVTHDKD